MDRYYDAIVKRHHRPCDLSVLVIPLCCGNNQKTTFNQLKVTTYITNGFTILQTVSYNKTKL